MGDITAISLMGTDVERIVSGLRLFNETWGSLLDIAVACWLLEQQLSLACLAPIVLVFGRVHIYTTTALLEKVANPCRFHPVFIMATSKVTATASPAQRQWIEKVQERLRVTSAVLGDIKTIKILGISQVLSGIIRRLRFDEIQTSRAFRKILVVILLLCKFLTSPSQGWLIPRLTNISSPHANQSSTRDNICIICHYVYLLEGRDAFHSSGFHCYCPDNPTYNTSHRLHPSTSNGNTMQRELRPYTGIL